MRAEVVIDLHDVSQDVGRALGRDDDVLPSLGKIVEMWRHLGVDVLALHIICPGSSNQHVDDESFAELRLQAWWKTEQAFLDGETFTAQFAHHPPGDDDSNGRYALITTTALHRSDELTRATHDAMVIVMTNSPEARTAVTHARGVPVMIAGTVVPDSSLSHARLDLTWMGLLGNRFGTLRLDDVEIRGGRPWSNGVAICTPFYGTEGRDHAKAVLPAFAESVALFDPEHFRIEENETDSAPENAGLAAVIHSLGLGNLVHIEEIGGRARDAGAVIAATLYRFTTDHPGLPVLLASNRPSTIVVSSDLDTYSIPNPRRVLRLCLTEREQTFDETAFASASAAARVVIERSLSEPLLKVDDTHGQDDGPNLQLIEGGEDAEPVYRSYSPTLVLYTNPNTVKDDSQEFRQRAQRRFLLLGANGAEASPADTADGTFLPISLGDCADFRIRRPALRPGCVVEGILNADETGWVIVSDPIERRSRRRDTTGAEPPATGDDEAAA